MWSKKSPKLVKVVCERPFFWNQKKYFVSIFFCFQLQRSDSCFRRKSPTSGERRKVGLCALRGWNHEKCGQRNPFFRDSSGIQGHWSLPRYRQKAYVKVFVTQWLLVPPFLVCMYWYSRNFCNKKVEDHKPSTQLLFG